MVDICFYCKRPKTSDVCQKCISKLLLLNWTSGNKYIDKFIQESQLKVNSYREFIEWIPFNRLRNIEYLAHGGFSTIYKAIWLDGFVDNVQRYRYIIDYDVKPSLNENEKKGIHVALKSLKNSSNISDDFLNELKNHLPCLSSCAAVRIFGITQDPETLNYMVVMDLMNGGNLRSNLLIKKYNPIEKYYNLTKIAHALLNLHKCNLVHGDFHSGNVLLYSIDAYSSNYISDFGLSRPVNQTINSNEIYGVIPYMAPEILRGKPYTKAADIYSFGIIMWEFTSGIPAFNNRPHDFNLSLDICKGLRPEIVKGTLPVYARLMKRCWDSDPNKRLTTEELHQIVLFWYDYYPKDYGNKSIDIPSNEQITKNHPLSCYTSRKIEYSAKINEILSQEELSTKFIIDEKKGIINEITLLSENLENFRIPDLKKF
ncbi:kinase-like domain-containing protein [Rhizophagus irregularis DAOM 181602=DAOM 197198]|uniref:Tpk3p n=2 Tax=Rhizophagus irregularis TaxID=588596 RepID=A0A015JHS6_RHIIW|nr:Tpk3p [Rhizophagus irregularis DAOM 197198w]GBC44985.2 kinase-like domain-containing protein [Rhizophagus irregularis DAOM 181602=DAOM 197198]